MLNKRQLQMMNDLEKTKAPITAHALAKKYEVSLRTIRNDVDEIALVVKKNHGNFIRLPRVGMRIVTIESISRKIENEIQLRDFGSLDSDKRQRLLLLAFLLKPAPLTLGGLCDLFEVSKGTIVNEIKELNVFIKQYGLELKGIKNKGYFLIGKELDVVSLLDQICQNTDPNFLCSSLFSADHLFFSETEKEKIAAVMDYISKALYWTINNPRLLEFWLAVFIRRNTMLLHKDSDFTDEEHTDSIKFKRFLTYLTAAFPITLDESALNTLKFILYNYTDYAEDREDVAITTELSKAVEAMVQQAVKLRPELKRDLENLKIDLIKHLKCSIDRSKLNLSNSNPLLNQIKVRYIDIFNLAKEVAKVFEQHYPMKLDEDEIGFLTLYFCRSLEKAQQLKEAMVMVVCNTGRGASKLLSTRIMNNFPEIHIVAMSSYLDLETMPEILENVDLVISTIPLPDLPKPYVIVSPFLTEKELTKVREAIWIGRQSHGPIHGNRLNEMVNSLIHQYVDYNDALEFSRKLDSLISSQEQRVYYTESEDNSELYAEISVEVFALIMQLFPKGLNQRQCSQASGLLAHVLMSIPRWQKGSFIQAPDFEQMKRTHEKEYRRVLNFLHTLEKKLDIFIDPIEVIALLRYIIY